MSNYFTQIAARNNYTENNDFIQPQFHNLFCIKEQQFINPFDNITDSEQINYPLLKSNNDITEITSESEPMVNKNHENIVSQANQKIYISSSQNQTSTLDKINSDNTKLFSDININNHPTQINIHRSNRNDPSVTDKAYKEKYILVNNVERDIQESDSLNNIRGDFVEKKVSTSDPGFKTETDQQQIKINEPLKVFRTELIAEHTIHNDINSKVKIIKAPLQNVVELKPPISQKNISTIEDKQEPRLVIGKLTVEVIQSPKEKILIKEIPQKHQTPFTQSIQNKTKSNSGLKVQFGLGQI